MKEKIGVYICHCGGNISDYVDVKKTREIVEKESGVVLAKDTMFACADSAQKEIVEDIKKNNLDAIVVASCSPKLHLYTFRNVAERAGLNPYNYVQCNIREQSSWAHTDKPKEATDKAVRLIRGAIARVRHSESLIPSEISAMNAVLIIGAGVAGMRAAIELADMGTDVYLAEKKHFVGGRVAQMGELFSTNENGERIISNLYKELKKREKIKLFTGAQLTSIRGSVGNFSANILINPRYIVPDCDRKKLEEAIKECTDEVTDEFNFGITKRKAIYKDYQNACPDLPVIDKDTFHPDDKFLKKYKYCIDLEQKVETLNIDIGAVLVCSGFDFYEPKEGEYGYHKFENVITLPQLIRLMELNNGKLVYKNNEIKNITFIYCVGSRETDGENKYCSRYCCTSALHTSLLLKKKYNNIQCYHLFRDMRSYGKYELLYEESSRNGDIFSKFDPEEKPVVENENGTLLVKFKDILTDHEELEIASDFVVLVTGMVPRQDSKSIADILKIPIGSDKFFNEVHPKLRPVETVIDGTYICGTCQGPKNIKETINSALSAAAKSNALINSGKIELEPIIIKIDPELCEWCAKCAEICPFDCITKIEHKKESKVKQIASVNIATCKGCGMCAPVCPYDAIDIVGYTNNEIESMIDALMKEV
jgi:heterodisulfide reductase subunit A